MSTIEKAIVVAASHHQLKGKLAHRSWPDLPEEIIRLIASFYLHDLATTTYCPATWEARRHWYSRMAYTCIRDSQELEKSLMAVCPEWRRAIEKHLFWNQALHIIDPNDHLIFHSIIQPSPQLNASSNAVQVPYYLSPYQHLRNIMKCTCIVCRINQPLSNQGLATSKRLAHLTYFGTVPLCKDHDKNRTTYCGLCLRDAALPGMKVDATARDYELQQQLGIVENEDDEAWPNVEMTCRKCRTDWLWRRANASTRDREAVGGPTFQCQDWEARQSIDNFIELAEGSMSDVLTLARDKHWLRMNTNYADLGNQLLASQKNEQRYNNGHEEEEDDSEEDRDGAFVSGSAQVREISLAHWARRRVLDGQWLSPADIWYNNRVPGQPTVVPTVHPCPWAREPESMDSVTGEDVVHPLQENATGEVPPSYQLCEQAYLQHVKAIREVLGPPMRNVVRKIVMECQVPTSRGFGDPAIIARNMHIEEVLRTLREEEGVWYDGVDWVERKRNEEEESLRRQADREASLIVSDSDVHSRRKEDDSDSTSSSSSGKTSSSTATSPVLSTTTLQTTPSPPPLGDEALESARKEPQISTSFERKEKMLASRPRFIPFDPVKSPPRLLGTIPYIPVTLAHLPTYSLEAVKSVWRDACSPLYHCTCSICERAKVADMNARALAYAATCPPPVVPSQPVQHTLQTTLYPVPVRSGGDTAEIELREVSEVDMDGDGEEEIDYEASELDYDEEEDEEEDEDLEEYNAPEENRQSVSPGPEVGADRPRKRSSDELEESLDEAEAQYPDSALRRFATQGISPKRARLDVDAPPDARFAPDADTNALRPTPSVPATSQPPMLVLQPSPVRLRKRGSGELDLALDADPPSPHKRAKIDRGVYDSRRPASDDGSVGIVYSPVLGEDEYESPPRLAHGATQERLGAFISQADMDSLISLEDADA